MQQDDLERAVQSLQTHSYAVVCVGIEESRLFADVERACLSFFEYDTRTKDQFAVKNVGELAFGFVKSATREWFHVADVEHVSWPDGLQSPLRQAFETLRDLTHRVLARLDPAAAQCWMQHRQSHGDGSVLDAFLYPNVAQTQCMGPHTDPGILTAKVMSRVPGMAIMDTGTRSWVVVDQPERANRDVLLMIGEQLEEKNDVHMATLHKVDGAKEQRFSLVFELREKASNTKNKRKGAAVEVDYLRDFVAKRSKAGSSWDAILAEFGVTQAQIRAMRPSSNEQVCSFLRCWLEEHD